MTDTTTPKICTCLIGTVFKVPDPWCEIHKVVIEYKSKEFIEQEGK